MKYYMDTEFIETDVKTLFGKKRVRELISVGIYCEDGREYHAFLKDTPLKLIWNLKDNFVKNNVLQRIHEDQSRQMNQFAKQFFGNLWKEFTLSSMRWIFKHYGRSRENMKSEIFHFMRIVDDDYGYICTEPIEIYTYYGASDWVYFTELLGGMMKLPKNFPMYSMDLKVMLQDRGLSKEWKQLHCPDPPGEHHALTDALWNHKLHQTIQVYDQSRW